MLVSSALVWLEIILANTSSCATGSPRLSFPSHRLSPSNFFPVRVTQRSLAAHATRWRIPPSGSFSTRRRPVWLAAREPTHFLLGWPGGTPARFRLNNSSCGILPEEYSLLHELAARVAERPVLVTFNGKTFDWPLLDSRFTMTRTISTPRLAAHLDLLHPARALWKLRLGSVRLVDLERHVLDAPRLGWHREEDIASSLIPQYYFDYLRGGSADPLIGVLRHNQMDLRGLAALFGKINTLLTSQKAERDGVDSLDLFGLSRFFERRGDSDRAHIACSQALDLGLPAEFRPRAHRDLALLAKRRGDHAAATELWLELASDPQDGVLACEQLAIHYERRAKDPVRATEFARLGLAKLQRLRANTRDPYAAARATRLAEKLLVRINRLEGKTKSKSADHTAPGLSLLKSSAT